MNTIGDSLLYITAVEKSRWMRCWIPLVIPQPKHSISSSCLDGQIDSPMSKYVEGNKIKIIGRISSIIKTILLIIFLYIFTYNDNCMNNSW